MHQAPVTAVAVHEVTGNILAAASDGTIIAISSVVRALLPTILPRNVRDSAGGNMVPDGV